MTGEVEKISATVEAAAATVARRSWPKSLRLVEQELAELKAAAAHNVLNPLRKTVPSATSEMLAKHGIGDGPVDVRTLDAALAGLSLEQRIAVKSQLAAGGSNRVEAASSF